MRTPARSGRKAVVRMEHKTETERRKSWIIGYYNPSVWLTLAGGGIAELGMYFAYMNRFNQAYFCLMLVGLIDLFDGPVARLVKRSDAEKAFGIQLDSLVDMVGFVALPIVIFLTLDYGRKWWGLALLILYMIAAIQRLGYFNVNANAGGESIRHYRGLPLTYSALILIWAWLILRYLISAWLVPCLAIVMLVTALLFVLDIPIAKPRGMAYVFFSLLAVITGYLLLR